MTKIYLFDWGDTLMVDFPGVPGKMCDWEVLEAVAGATETLAHLSTSSPVYIATNAAESNEAEIEQAFERVGLARYISGYFCKANLGLSKNEPGFYQAILERLNFTTKLDTAEQVTSNQVTLNQITPNQVTPNQITHNLIKPYQITMVGDNLDKDIHPALAAGLNALWFNPKGQNTAPNIKQIQQLTELCV